MKLKMWKWIVACLVGMALLPAHAQMWRHQMQERRADDERTLPARQEAPPREMDPRQEFRPHGQMTVEERRQLRRDIHEAGRELYIRNPRRGPPQ